MALAVRFGLGAAFLVAAFMAYNYSTHRAGMWSDSCGHTYARDIHGVTLRLDSGGAQ